jgi:hypothetical protein
MAELAAHPPAPHDARHATSTGISNEKMVMWAFLGSECLLFGALISTYLLYRHKSVSGPTPHSLYDIPFTSVSSFVLLMSSLSMALAVAAIQRGDQRRLRVWLSTTALLGSVFIGGQIYEFTTFIRRGMTIKTNVTSVSTYGSAWKRTAYELQFGIVPSLCASALEKPKSSAAPNAPTGRQRPKINAASAMKPRPSVMFSLNECTNPIER